MGDDLVRIEIHRGVEDLLFHTLRLKRLCAYAVDTSDPPGLPVTKSSDPAETGRAEIGEGASGLRCDPKS